MDANFWLQRWERNQIAFHQSQTNPLLIDYFDTLSLSQGSRVFVPLCGKTLDIAWLLAQGCLVAGAELSPLAIEQLFHQLGIEPDITNLGAIKRYSAPNIDIFVGDIFDVTREMLEQVDAVFDRAALVALPEDVRPRYARHLTEITANASQLLITFEYDQSQMDGPPFSVRGDELHRHYDDHYDLTSLISRDVAGGLRGGLAAQESVWLLKPRA
jgi:thiopurine S-methyltransferase